MQPPGPPKVTAVEVVAARPTEADSAAIAHLSALADKSLPQVAYVVKVHLKSKPPATSMAWALYVNDVLIPKYWEYKDGIYFTVLDPEFFAEYRGKRLRFSQNGVDFYDTGMKLAAPTKPAAASKSKSKGKAARLPLQADVLK
jgi:hypothetical protein